MKLNPLGAALLATACTLTAKAQFVVCSASWTSAVQQGRCLSVAGGAFVESRIQPNQYLLLEFVVDDQVVWKNGPTKWGLLVPKDKPAGTSYIPISKPLAPGFHSWRWSASVNPNTVGVNPYIWDLGGWIIVL